jgi:hypothetical protein
VGEVGNLIRTGWVSRESLRAVDQKRLRVPICTCGKRLDVPHVETPDEACPFWSAVRREWVARADAEAIESYPNSKTISSPRGAGRACSTRGARRPPRSARTPG